MTQETAIATAEEIAAFRERVLRKLTYSETPYRCMSCVHRFFGPGRRNLLQHNPLIAAIGGSTLLVVIAVVLIMWAWKS